MRVEKVASPITPLQTIMLLIIYHILQILH